ncbi:hypothetical protein FRC10_002949 [Ceratobasidium sp. 414]|nr:hypothetical protein FRC10_002949 [Ceratobasidium sp. 414]
MNPLAPAQTSAQADKDNGATSRATELVDQAAIGIDLFLRAVEDLAGMDIDLGDFDNQARENLETMAGQMVEIPEKVKYLKRMLEEHLEAPKTKRAQKGIKEGETHAADLFDLATKHELDLDEYMRSFNATEENGSLAIENGYFDALTSIKFTPEELTDRLKQHGIDLGSPAIVESVTSIGLGSGFTSLHKTYNKLQVLSFVIKWSKYEGAGGRKKKGRIFEQMFLGSKKGKMAPDVHKLAEFKTYKNHLRDDIKGANRLLNAYRTLGVIVIFHPSLEFQYFRSSHMGPNASKLTVFLHNKLEGKTYLSDMESSCRALLWATLAALCLESTQLKNRFRKVLQSAGSISIQLEE